MRLGHQRSPSISPLLTPARHCLGVADEFQFSVNPGARSCVDETFKTAHFGLLPLNLIRTSIDDKYSGSMKNAARLDHVSLCKTASGTIS